MVLEVDAERVERLLQRVRFPEVGLSGKGAAGRVVVDQDDRAGAVLEGAAGDRLRVDDGGILAAGREPFVGEEPSGVVQVQGPAFFVVEQAEAGEHQAIDGFRCGEAAAVGEVGLAGRPASEFEGSLQGHRLVDADALLYAKRLDGGRGERRKVPAGGAQQLLGGFQGVEPACPRPQEDGDEFGVGEVPHPQAPHLFPGAFGPVEVRDLHGDKIGASREKGGRKRKNVFRTDGFSGYFSVFY